MHTNRKVGSAADGVSQVQKSRGPLGFARGVKFGMQRVVIYSSMAIMQRR